MENAESNASFPCEKCGRLLKSKSGQKNHQNKCKWKDPEISDRRKEEKENKMNEK